ncbi:MAG: hypothetical protein OXE85_15195 [Roseovarius sp.]|nr:hypothetical protein [Roseovarius sp.]
MDILTLQNEAYVFEEMVFCDIFRQETRTINPFESRISLAERIHARKFKKAKQRSGKHEPQI